MEKRIFRIWTFVSTTRIKLLEYEPFLSKIFIHIFVRAYRFIILSCKVAILRDFIAKSFLHFEPTIFLCTCVLLSSIPYHSSQKKIIRMIRLLFTRSKISIYLISRDRIILSLNLYNFSLRIYYHTFFHSLPLIIEKKKCTRNFQN